MLTLSYENRHKPVSAWLDKFCFSNNFSSILRFNRMFLSFYQSKRYIIELNASSVVKPCFAERRRRIRISPEIKLRAKNKIDKSLNQRQKKDDLPWHRSGFRTVQLEDVQFLSFSMVVCVLKLSTF